MKRSVDTQIMIVDDHFLIRESIKMQLDLVEDCNVIATGATALECVQLCQKYQPDIVFLDLSIPKNAKSSDKANAIDLVSQIAHLPHKTNVVILSSYLYMAILESLFNSGVVKGYILKSDSNFPDLGYVIRMVNQGKIFLSSEVKDALVEAQTNQFFPLTARQIDVVNALYKHSDKSLSEVASIVGLAEGSLRNMLSNVNRQLNVNNRTSCLLRCIQYGYIIV